MRTSLPVFSSSSVLRSAKLVVNTNDECVRSQEYQRNKSAAKYKIMSITSYINFFRNYIYIYNKVKTPKQTQDETWFEVTYLCWQKMSRIVSDSINKTVSRQYCSIFV